VFHDGDVSLWPNPKKNIRAKYWMSCGFPISLQVEVQGAPKVKYRIIGPYKGCLIEGP
jgi:hypothetical protein